MASRRSEQGGLPLPTLSHHQQTGGDAKLELEWQPVFAFAVKLIREPGAVGARDRERLRKAGLSDLQILDLVLSVSRFAWANRLMHTLGEAEHPVTTPEGE